MKINFTYTGPNPQRVNYVLGFIQGHPYMPRHVYLSLNDWSDAERRIDYSPMKVPFEKDHEYYMPAQEMMFAFSKNNIKWYANEYIFAGRSLYSVESIERDKSVFIKDRRFGFDICEAIFFHLTRHEEYYADASIKDQWDMMHEDYQFLVLNNLYQQPVVDNLVSAFLLAMGIEPESFKSTLTITHDIDVLEKFENNRKVLRSILGSLKRGKSIQSALKVYKIYKETKLGKSKDPYDTFDQLFSESNHRKIVYFMAGGSSINDDQYDINSSLFRSISDLAIDRGYQIGLHPSYNSYRDYEMITDERNRLQLATDKKVRTSRQHFLRFAFDETITALSDSGIYEDSTLGYQRKIGFRCGTAFTFLIYDLRRDRMSRVSETPMVIMDGALLEECDGDVSKANELLGKFMNEYANDSHLCINFHNTIFDPTRYDAQAMWNMYFQIIEKYN